MPKPKKLPLEKLAAALKARKKKMPTEDMPMEDDMDKKKKGLKEMMGKKAGTSISIMIHAG